MKKPQKPEPGRRSMDPASKDAVRYRAAREVIEKVEGKIAEEEEDEQLQKPGQILVRIMVGAILIAWIIVMVWIAVNSLKKKERASLPGSHLASLV